MESIVGDKSYKFAVRIVRLYQYLIKNHNEYMIGKQILRSGTSVGANIEEALGAISKKEFIAKIQIAYKECRETRFWLHLLFDTEFIDKALFESMMKDCEELIKLTTSILKTSKLNSEKVNSEE
jgi:four helix bundle protein